MPMLITAVKIPRPIWTDGRRDADAKPYTDATVIAEFAITRPTTNVTNTASPAMMPPAVAAARNTTTWVLKQSLPKPDAWLAMAKPT